MKKGLWTCIVYFAVLCASSACRKEGVPAEPGTGEDCMTFSTEVSSVRSVSTDDTSLKNHSIGIYGVVSSTEGAAGSSVFETTNVTELKYGTEGTDYSEDLKDGYKGWYYTPLQYWKRNQYYRFRAYHPYEAEVFETGNGADDLVVIYSMTPGRMDTWNNYDLLTAFATRYTGDADPFAPVELKFNHALSALRFFVTYAEDNDYVGTLRDFWIEGLRAYGTMNYTHTDGTVLDEVIRWDSAYYYDDKQFYLTDPNSDFTFEKPVNVYDPSAKESTDPAGGMVFVVPQTISRAREDGSGIDWTTVCFKTQKSGDAVNRVNLPTTTWEPGKIYTYTLHLGTSSIVVDVTSADWEVLESNIDIRL